MAILFAPMLEGKLPAQAEKLNIPYTPNPMVGTYAALALRIKSLSTETVVIQDKILKSSTNIKDDYFLYTNINGRLEIGQFYKIQVAYMENISDPYDSLYWSSVSIFKWTKQFDVANELTDDLTLILQWMPEFMDASEPIYCYEIKIIESNKNKILFNHTEFYPSEYFSLDLPLFPSSKEHKINVDCITINGYKQNIVNQRTEFQKYNELDLNSINFSVNFNQETLSCVLQGKNLNGCQIVRESNNSFLSLHKINSSSNFIFNDYSVYPNNYIYEIRGNFWVVYEGDLCIFFYDYYTVPILVDFEDIYLSDEDHILCIKFNPKVGSFKETVLENKIDTLGGQFPFFFRNGHTKYKEFSINGLISYHMDNKELFLDVGQNIKHEQRTKTKSVGINKNFIPSSQLTTDNVIAEREFKLAVLEWLNNGKPKLFRSATEGAYLVRLMNVSLSPEDQLGRMLHSFSATAYEMAEYNETNLRKYNFIPGGNN